MRRQHIFDASRFGSLLSAEAWERVPEEKRAMLIRVGAELLADTPRWLPLLQRAAA